MTIKNVFSLSVLLIFFTDTLQLGNDSFNIIHTYIIWKLQNSLTFMDYTFKDAMMLFTNNIFLNILSLTMCNSYLSEVKIFW